MTSKPSLESHCGFITDGDESNISLFRVVKRSYTGDDIKFEVHKIITIERTHKKAAAILLLETAQNNILIDNLVITNPEDFYKLAVCKEKDAWCDNCYKWYITNHVKCNNCGWEFTTPIEER